MTKLILFDIDGTLLISRGIGRAAKRRAMLECFGTTGELDAFTFGGKTDWGILAELLAPQGYSTADIGSRILDYEAVMARHMQAIRGQHSAQPLPHALALVHELRQRDSTLIGIVTGNTSKTAMIKLEMAGFSPGWFPIGAYGQESPHRDELTKLAKSRAEAHLGQALKGSDIIVIGDTPADIQAARAIDAIAVGLHTGFADRDSLARSQPDFLLDDLGSFMAQVLP